MFGLLALGLFMIGSSLVVVGFILMFSVWVSLECVCGCLFCYCCVLLLFGSLFACFVCVLIVLLFYLYDFCLNRFVYCFCVCLQFGFAVSLCLRLWLFRCLCCVSLVVCALAILVAGLC